MTPEQAIQLDANPIWKAFKEGKTIQKKLVQDWFDFDELDPDYLIQDPISYRIKPEKKRVPLAFGEVKIGYWLRYKTWAVGECELITSVRPRTVSTHGCSLTYSDLKNGYEISQDGGQTWLPCWKEVEE